MSIIHFSIDVQPGDKPFLEPVWGSLMEGSQRLIAGLEDRDIPTVHVLLCNRQDDVFEIFPNGVGRYADSPPNNLEILKKRPIVDSALPLHAGSYVAYKTDYALTAHAEITDFIKNAGFTKIILSGIWEARDDEDLKQGNFCVSESARGLSADYDVIIAADATNCTGVLPLAERQRLNPFARFATVGEIVSEIDAGRSMQAKGRPLLKQFAL